ncbi:MAG: hypothetical protein JO248_04810 [Acidimicrobiia bacterium]|nr:hypothetical protein [Acidimicrobiia bacterium]MBV9285811.1 hypothetical protein [Acidimicrobiia bacterium]
MVLVSFLLVLAAAVTLVIGLLNSGLGLIYVSIGCSVAAGIVLALAVVRSRPERAAAPAAGTERLRALEDEEAPAVTVVPSRGRRRGAEPEPQEDETVAVGSDGEGVFPIADYDDLKVGEIVSLLPELDEDELDMVRDREEAGKNRSTILTRVEALSGAAPAAASRGGDDWGSWDRGADEEPEDDEDVFVTDEEGIFPIADYDDLKAAEVVSLLPELDDDELEQVRDREERTAGRATVLNRIDQLLGIEPAPAKKAPAKKKAAAKKAPAKKKAAAKKAPAKKSAAKKSTAKKSTAKKTAKKS